jgi:hypothetical protein
MDQCHGNLASSLLEAKIGKAETFTMDLIFSRPPKMVQDLQ